MRRLLISALALLLMMTLVPRAGFAGEDVTITAADGFALGATYYPGADGGAPILLLHQCNADRHAYDDLAPLLAEAGFHVLTLDFRGFGDSRTPETPPFRRGFDELWPQAAPDVDAAVAYLLARPGVGDSGLGVLGASCGGTQAALLTQRRSDVRAVVLFSSGLPWGDEATIERFKKSPEIPILGIASEEDTQTYAVIREVFLTAKHPDNRLILYRGKLHGAPLFEHDPSLMGVMRDWFVQHLGGKP